MFILCAMLGFRFCPRLRDLPDRKLATLEPAAAYKDLAPLIGRRVKVEVIREHWDEILRLVASLQAGAVLPSAMLKRLAAFQRQNQLDLALQELGRIERTLFTIDWLESAALRQRCQAGLNKSEQRHALAQVICTFKQGRIADRGQDAQQFRASRAKPGDRGYRILELDLPDRCHAASAKTKADRCRTSCSPTRPRSRGSTSPSPATSCGTARPQQQTAADRSD